MSRMDRNKKLHEQLAKEEQRAAHKETIFARRETKSVRRPQKEEEYSAENDFAQQRENDQNKSEAVFWQSFIKKKPFSGRIY